MTATISVHLGLTEAIADVIKKIASCPQCASFWMCVLASWHCDCDIIEIVVFSAIGAYLSNWFGLLLSLLINKYEELWQKVNRKK